MNTDERPVHAFYAALKPLVLLPTRPSIREGIAWRSGVHGWFHHVYVYPYAGTLGKRMLRDPERIIPRIALNECRFLEPTRRRRRLWSQERPYSSWIYCPHSLELTVTLDELVDFVPYVVGWAQACESNAPGRVPAPPHPLDLGNNWHSFVAGYRWSLAANDEYGRWEERRRLARARAAERRAGRLAPVLQPETSNPL